MRAPREGRPETLRLEEFEKVANETVSKMRSRKKNAEDMTPDSGYGWQGH
jgi:hypothetical protein